MRETQKKLVQFCRAPSTRGQSTSYEAKYAQLIVAVKFAKKESANGVVVAAPWVLGDNYSELSASLNLIAGAKLVLYIGGTDEELDAPSEGTN